LWRYNTAGTSKGCGCLLVVDDDRTLLGTFSDADLRRALTLNGEDVLKLPVKDLMNYKKEFPRTTTVDAMAFDAHLKMVGPRGGGGGVEGLREGGKNKTLVLSKLQHLFQALSRLFLFFSTSLVCFDFS
jgi:hypothetical protein